MTEDKRRHRTGKLLCGFGLLASLCLTGCQVRIGGQTLPSPYYVEDDVQYFPAGHEFPLQNEADFLNAQKAPAAAEDAGLSRRSVDGMRR